MWGGAGRLAAQDFPGVLPGEVKELPPKEEAAKRTKAKLKAIRMSVDFETASFEEVADYFRMRARALDELELDPNCKGINVVVRSAGVNRRNTGVFKVEDQPLEEIFKRFAAHTRTRWYVTEFGVVFEDLEARRFVLAPAPNVRDEDKIDALYKLKNIVIPVVDFEDTTLDAARDFLISRCRELDVFELDPKKKGIRFALSERALEDVVVHELKLLNVSAYAALQAIAMTAEVQFRVGSTLAEFVPFKPEN